MSKREQRIAYKQEISQLFKTFYKNRLITERDGNACIKIENAYLTTASTCQKNNLKLSNFSLVDSNSDIIENQSHSFEKPSIETKAHVSAINATNKNFSIHVHSPKTIALFQVFATAQFLTVKHLIETLNSSWPELSRYTKVGEFVPFLYPGSDELHDAIHKAFSNNQPDIIVLEKHGVFAVGNSLQEASEHISRLEHISSIMLDTINASNMLSSVL